MSSARWPRTLPTQQASIPKFLELPELTAGVAPGFRSRGARSTSQGIELHDLFLPSRTRCCRPTRQYGRAIGKTTAASALVLRGQSASPIGRNMHDQDPCLRAVSDHRLGPRPAGRAPRGVAFMTASETRWCTPCDTRQDLHAKCPKRSHRPALTNVSYTLARAPSRPSA